MNFSHVYRFLIIDKFLYCQPQPFNTFAQTLKLEHIYGNGLPLIYIACINPQLPIMKEMSNKIRADKKLHWEYIELNSGHDAMLTKPKELTEILLGLIK